MSKKKILFVTENLYGGGVERILQIILSHFNYDKYDVTLYSICRYDYNSSFFSPYVTYKYIYDALSPQDSVWTRLYKTGKNKLKLMIYTYCSANLFYKLFVNENADVVIAFIEGYATRVVSGFPEYIRKIAWVHTDLVNNHWTKVAYRNNKEELYAYSCMDTIVCVSRVVKEMADKCLGVGDKTIVLYNPIDYQEIVRKSNELVDVAKSSKLQIVSLGTLIPIKGFDRLIRVLAQLNKEGVDIELCIYGRGENLNVLKQLSQDLHISDIVHFCGFKENPYPYLKNADIYVCSSIAEGYNTAITEALILGRPVVSTECSGVKEQLGDDNEWGICCSNSEEGLYEGLKEMLTDDNMLHYTRQACKRGTHFTLELSMNEIYKLIEL
ncbi:glycosyltransferase [Bacteroides sp. f07]|uniref:glycosyltransferase n=1 Tax=Bacteroides sp. f07 TaxID=3132704 RepID=UPI0034B6FBE2